MKKKIKEFACFGILRLATVTVLSALFIILYFITIKGVEVVGWGFLTQMPHSAMTAGGIFPVILGTVYLTVGAVLFALPLGVGAAIYLVEYAKQRRLIRIIRIGVNNLAGVPSVVFGLFGFVVFVKFFGFGVSILAGSLTLGILILPLIIRASEEALLAIPQTFRDASFALGATKWQTIYKIVLPNAASGIITGLVLGVAAAASETAAILFVAVTFFTVVLPHSVFCEVQVLTYHIYALLTEGTRPDLQVPIAYGTAFVLVSLVLAINLIAIIMRIYARRRKKW